ncbi:hypothetical protein AgCh_033251 [Apium graveolens]
MLQCEGQVGMLFIMQFYIQCTDRESGRARDHGCWSSSHYRFAVVRAIKNDNLEGLGHNSRGPGNAIVGIEGRYILIKRVRGNEDIISFTSGRANDLSLCPVATHMLPLHAAWFTFLLHLISDKVMFSVKHKGSAPAY